MKTWGDIKLETLHKMFAASGDTIPNDTSTRDYLAAMPGAANEALQLLATAGKFIIKKIEIAHNPVKNLLGGNGAIQSIERGTLTFEADKVRSVFFEYFGNVTYKIKVDGVDFATESLPKNTGYAEFRKQIINPADGKVTLEISSDYPFAVKNVALYSANFETEEEIPTFSEKVLYNLGELTNDFYALADTAEPIVYEGNYPSRYQKITDYFQEGNSILALDRDKAGNYRIYYKAYPQNIDRTTPDDAELVLDPEVVALLPLYMASQLYKDDDNGIATSYRNEFEVAFSRLRDSVVGPSAEAFTSESGWI